MLNLPHPAGAMLLPSLIFAPLALLVLGGWILKGAPWGAFVGEEGGRLNVLVRLAIATLMAEAVALAVGGVFFGLLAEWRPFEIHRLLFIERSLPIRLADAPPLGNLFLLWWVVLRPVAEEIVARGWLLGWLKPRIGRSGARLISAALPAALYPNFPGELARGLILGEIRLRTGLATAIIARLAGALYLSSLLRARLEWGDTVAPILELSENRYEYIGVALLSLLWMGIYLRGSGRTPSHPLPKRLEESQS